MRRKCNVEHYTLGTRRVEVGSTRPASGPLGAYCKRATRLMLVKPFPFQEALMEKRGLWFKVGLKLEEYLAK